MARIGRGLRTGLVVVGVATVLMLASGFTNYPWKLYQWFAAMEPLGDGGEPTLIVILGGGGIPSESGLMRSYRGAEAALAYPDCTVVIALPADGDPETSSVGLMKKELVMRGVDASRVRLEHDGRNTREQALLVAGMYSDSLTQERVLLVTTQAHVRRSFLTFQKAGFMHIGATSAYDESAEADMVLKGSDVGGRFQELPHSIEGNLTLRYQFWHRIDYLQKSARESLALAYYLVKGWI